MQGKIQLVIFDFSKNFFCWASQQNVKTCILINLQLFLTYIFIIFGNKIKKSIKNQSILQINKNFLFIQKLKTLTKISEIMYY